MPRSVPTVQTAGLLPANPTGWHAAGKFSRLARLLVKAGIFALVINEVRGLILAGPVLYAIYAAGGTWTALWVGLSSLAGVAASVAVPLLIARKLKLNPARAA